jgi:hypothetical protein
MENNKPQKDEKPYFLGSKKRDKKKVKFILILKVHKIIFIHWTTQKPTVKSLPLFGEIKKWIIYILVNEENNILIFNIHTYMAAVIMIYFYEGNGIKLKHKEQFQK